MKLYLNIKIVIYCHIHLKIYYTLDQIKSQMIIFIYMLKSNYTIPIISFLLVANPAGEHCGAFSSQRA